jgi:hypothetical protein
MILRTELEREIGLVLEADTDEQGAFFEAVVYPIHSLSVDLAVPSSQLLVTPPRTQIPYPHRPVKNSCRDVLRDRDAIYGRDFADMTRDMGMEEVLTAPRSPGKIRLRNDSWAPSGASAWATLSCGIRDRCVGLCKVILPTITGHVHI